MRGRKPRTEMNWMEERVLKQIKQSKAGIHIRAIAKSCFPGVRPITKADSRTRNALRFLRAHDEIEQCEKGTYRSL